MRPGLDIAVRVEFTARQVPSQAGNETSEAFDTLLGTPLCTADCVTGFTYYGINHY